MSIEDEMNIDERRKYLHKMKKRYDKASQKEKGDLLAVAPVAVLLPPASAAGPSRRAG